MIGWLSMTNTSLVVHVNEDEGLLKYEKIVFCFLSSNDEVSPHIKPDEHDV